MLVRCSLKNYVLRNTAVIIVYGEPMELPRCGAEKICAPDTGTGREAAGPAPAPATTIVFSGSLGVQQTQGDRSQCGTSPVTGARGE